MIIYEALYLHLQLAQNVTIVPYHDQSSFRQIAGEMSENSTSETIKGIWVNVKPEKTVLIGWIVGNL